MKILASKTNCLEAKEHFRPSKDLAYVQRAELTDSERLGLEKRHKKEHERRFADGVYPTHNIQPQYGWILKGKDKEIRSNSKMLHWSFLTI